jgi:hypothetical protein
MLPEPRALAHERRRRYDGRMLFLALSEEYKYWEHRIGSFQTRCPMCGIDAWQLLFRLYKNQGTMLQPPTPYTPPMAERYQVRCSACTRAAPAGHPATWVTTLQVPFQNENYPVMPATPGYSGLAFSTPY